MARISIIKNNIESDQNKVMALFKLENSLVCGIGDRFIIRQYSRVVTIAGGIIDDIIISQFKCIYEDSNKYLCASQNE